MEGMDLVVGAALAPLVLVASVALYFLLKPKKQRPDLKLVEISKANFLPQERIDIPTFQPDVNAPAIRAAARIRAAKNLILVDSPKKKTKKKKSNKGKRK